jgi:hypothetical protein
MVCHESQETDFSVYDQPYLLRKEAHESWDYIVSDKMVYGFNFFDGALNSLMGIAKDYVEGNLWIEVHVTFKSVFHGERNAHYTAILNSHLSINTLRHLEVKNSAVVWNPPMLVDDTHLVETPQEVAPNTSGILSVIWLKRFDDRACLCGYTPSLLVESAIVPLLKNRELSSVRVGQGKCGEGPDHLVERCTHVVEDIPHDNGNSVRNIDNLRENPNPLVFNIVLGANLNFGLIKNVELLPESIKVFLRSGCLEVGVSQVQHEANGSVPGRG